MEDILQTHTGDTGIFTMAINRPEKRNAVNFQLISRLREALAYAAKAEEVKLIVIRGAGERAFCSGGDLHEFHSLTTAQEAEVMLSEMGRVLYDLATIEKPTFAYINGMAVGGGCEIASACDVRIARSHAKFGFIQANQGITTGWGGGTLLAEKLNPSEAVQLLMSGNIFTAEEGVRTGFISRIVENDSEFAEYIDSFGSKSSEVLKSYKRILIEKWKKGHLKARMEEEIRMCSILWETEEHLSAVRRFNSRA